MPRADQLLPDVVALETALIAWGSRWNAPEELGFLPLRRTADRALRLKLLEAALLEWGKAWHLQDGWCLDVALRTLMDWTRHGHSRGFWTTFASSQKFALPTFEFRAEWTPKWATEAAFRAGAREHFEKELSAYVERVKNEAQAAGWRKVEEKRREKHFEILVRWQCQRWTKRRIAEEYGLGMRKAVGPPGRVRTIHTGISAVTDALARTASLIRLSLRKGKQGRRAHP